jgi:hypothetical protein
MQLASLATWQDVQFQILVHHGSIYPATLLTRGNDLHVTMNLHLTRICMRRWDPYPQLPMCTTIATGSGQFNPWGDFIRAHKTPEKRARIPCRNRPKSDIVFAWHCPRVRAHTSPEQRVRILRRNRPKRDIVFLVALPSLDSNRKATHAVNVPFPGECSGAFLSSTKYLAARTSDTAAGTCSGAILELACSRSTKTKNQTEIRPSHANTIQTNEPHLIKTQMNKRQENKTNQSATISDQRKS